MLNQALSAKQGLRINPKQLKLLELFHLNTFQLEQRIKDEILENPLIEENEQAAEPDEVPTRDDKNDDFRDFEEYQSDDIPDYRTELKQRFSSEEIPDRPLVMESDFRAALKLQLSFVSMTDKERKFAHFLVGSLDGNGLLDRPLEALSEDFSLKTGKWIEDDQAETILKKIQKIGPAGIGARDIRECMLLQLRQETKKCPLVKAAIVILENYYELLTAGQFEKIEKVLDLEAEDLRAILDKMANLSLHPAESSSYDDITNRVTPDFILVEDEGGPRAILARQRGDSVRVSNRMKSLCAAADRGRDKRALVYLENKLKAAEWFVDAIRQRENTMQQTIDAIVRYQHAYFLTGDREQIKPMVLKDIAQQINVDISTVSRITSNKYIQTSFGTIHLKKLFSEGINYGEGKVVSNIVIQKTLEDLIKAENKKVPYTDKQLAAMLAQKGMAVARRTVAKYRDSLKIPNAEVRSILI